MTNSSARPRTVRGFAIGGRKALVAGLSLALLGVGASGVALASTPVAGTSNSGVALAAAQDTVLATYSNSQAAISIKKRVAGSGSDTVISFIADITLSDGAALKSAFAKGSLARGNAEPVSTTASANNAVLAINGDYCGFRDNGIVIRNGVSYRDKGKRMGLATKRDGTFMLYDETKTTAANLIAANVWQTISFGPALVDDGKIPSGIDKYEIDDFGTVSPGAPGSIQGQQPRTGVGLIDKNHILFIVVDGRGAGGSRGATMTEFAQLFLDLGAKTAYNLDGGGSATMVFRGTDINSPSGGTERATSDIFYISK